ncbi:MAG: SDR family oxidoreductase [Candidatus Promineofilum sp.]|nr:SDR family oxidoreductase [Promineifilum sp.]
MGKSILVIGAGGNVGREVVRHLAERGATARAAVTHQADTARPPDGAAEAVLFDFLNPDTFPAAFDGVERMFLLRPPAISAVRRDILPAIEYAAVAGVRQIAFLSLVGAERNRVVPHAKIEALLRASGIPWTMLRCGFFMQNLNTTHRADIVEHGDLFIPGGRGATSFIDVRDIGAVAARTLTEAGHDGRAYELTGTESLTYGDVAAVMTEELGRPITYSNPSMVAFARRMRRRGHPWSYIWVMEGIYLTTRLGMAAAPAPDAERLLERPPITMLQYVRDYADAFEQA